jgi:dTDP-4-dehydrorhamnose 3,5-epimerase/CDP-3, 6-dideoxy-D-glycero-D-glycero-4-hexulose-5-epimerase
MEIIDNFSGSVLYSFKTFNDKRGILQKIYSEDLCKKFFNFNLCDQYFSFSKKNVIRGIHFQLSKNVQSKIITCIKGEVLDLIIDLRKKSKTFRKFKTYILSEKNRNHLYVHEGFGHAFLALKDSIMIYNTSSNFSKKTDSGILYNSIGFEWPVNKPIISDRDLKFKKLEEFKNFF